MSATMKRVPLSLPTYVPGAPNDLPFFLEKKAYQGATGRVYPIPYTDRISNEPQAHTYEAVVLENEHIAVTLLPELGGKVHGAVDKHNGYAFVYQNTVIKPAMVGLAGPWVSGGIEFNWPQHHRPTTFMPLEATLQNNPDGSKTCWMGESEPFHRMRGAVGVTVYPGKTYLEAKAVVYNRTEEPLPFMWWNNLAVRVHPQYKAIFPPDVAFGNDHDRRAVIPFPVMKGVYRTARPFDYGEGTDATWFSNIKLPTSVMVARGQSEMDFLGGYDFAADAGTITVADHHISCGKKMWTWGDGDFGNAWCANLTDNGDRYIELMTGVYTDNQPDFTYIMPGECKTFTQVWYPVRGIGEVSNATREGALSVRVAQGCVTVGALTTAAYPGALLTVCAGETALLAQSFEMQADEAVFAQASLPEGCVAGALHIRLADAQGKLLVDYRPPVLGQRKPPAARPIPPRPAEVESLEELYLHGAHLRQYKHHTYSAADYFGEALRREANDLRCNTAMGQLALEQGDWEAARVYLDRAVSRSKWRNDNPADPEAIYTRARLDNLCGRSDEALAGFQAAAWQYGWRSAAYYEVACLQCRRGQRSQATETLTLALKTNADHYAARVLLGYLRNDPSAVQTVLQDAPQDVYARFALWLMAGRTVEAFVLARAEDVLDAALDFAHAGLADEAIHTLRACTAPTQLLYYHLAALTGEAPIHAPLDYCFPNRLEDVAVLNRDEWQAQYLLGCLYYDRQNVPAARHAWERSRALNPEHAYAHRNLAQLYFDHAGLPSLALRSLREALALAPDNARILYELLQLLKNTRATVQERIALLEAHAPLVRERDDCYLEWIILYTQTGEYRKARELLLGKRFNIYEGGEGKLTRHHGWLYILMAREAQAQGHMEDAAAWLATALVYPQNYGEGRHFSAQEGNIHYYTGLLHETRGDGVAAENAYQKALRQPGHITEVSYFAALAAAKLNEPAKAASIFAEMLRTGEEKLRNADLPGYYGVGMAAPLPYELDIRRMNAIDAHLLIALGAKGLGDAPRSEEALAALRELDPTNSKLDFLGKLDVC